MSLPHDSYDIASPLPENDLPDLLENDEYDPLGKKRLTTTFRSSLNFISLMPMLKLIGQ